MSKPRRRVRPADVIEGKARPGPRALVSMIAEVNPTGRGLKPAEQARRYAEKSALQSLLLRWHGDAFFAERTDDDGIVLIRHRHFDECACHAQVSSLDDDARAWVWRTLDDGTSAGEPRADARREPAAPSQSAGNAAELLARAQSALAAYDYELAERLLVGAFEQSAGDVSAARALLELLVDVLGQDARALDLEPRLSGEARADPPVCSLIGLAAARSGDAARALAIASDLTHPRAGEICAEAGRAALRAGDVEQARACAARARALGATPEAASLEVAIEEALRERARDEDARLDALVAAGDAEAAEALARELLSTGLPSESAKRVLREAAARRADAAQRELTAQARAALEESHWTAARRALDELARLGRPDPALESALDEAQREAAAARDAQLVSDVLDALSRSTEEGLSRYLALGEPLRARVRAQGPTSLCERAELVRDALKTRRVDHVIAAVQRIGELERALERGESEAALAAKEALPRGLDGIPLVRDLVARALAMLAEQQTRAVDEHIPQAFDAMLSMDWDGVSRHLAAIPPASLALVPRAQEGAAAMTRTAAHARESEARVACAREPDADLAALHAGRSAAQSLTALMQELASAETISEHTGRALDGARRWAEQADDLTRALTAALRFEEHPVPEGTLVDLEDERGLGARAPDVRIARDGRIWFLASPEERCYLTEAALPELAVTRRFSFSVGGVRRGQGVMPIGDQLWVPLSDGGMLVLDRRTPSTVIDLWWGSETEADTPKHSDDVWTAIAPDGSAVATPQVKTTKRQVLLRAPTSATTRLLHHCAAVSFFGRPERMRALVTGGRRRSWYVVDTKDLTPFGGPERFAGELADFVPIAAIEDPTYDRDDPQAGYVFLAVDAGSLDGAPDALPRFGALYLVRVTADLKPVQHALVSPGCRELRAWLYHRGPEHILVVHERGALPHFDLFDAATLERVGGRKGLPGLTVPVQSASGRNVVLLERTHRAFCSVERPTSLEDGLDAVTAVPFLSGRISPRSSCSRVPDAWDRRPFVDQLDIALLKAVTARGDRARLVARTEAAGYMRAFSELVLERTTASVLLKLLWHGPDEPGGAWGFLHGAEHAVVLCPEDPEVVSRLEAATQMYDGPADRGHSLHLLGLAHLAAGRRTEAIAAWREGASMKGHMCPFNTLIAITGGPSERARDEAGDGVRFPPFMADHATRYEDAVRALVRLDAALEQGRGADGWEEARRVRDLVGPSWQLSARVAQLHLDHPDPRADPWRYQLDLAWMASRAWLGPTRNHMIFAGCHWDHHRFTAIAERAGATLDAMGVGPAERVKEQDVEPSPAT